MEAAIDRHHEEGAQLRDVSRKMSSVLVLSSAELAECTCPDCASVTTTEIGRARGWHGGRAGWSFARLSKGATRRS